MTDPRDVVVKLKAVQRSARGSAAKAAATAMGHAFVRGVVAVELSRYSHSRGTPTLSPVGEPPARVSGALARSIRKGPTVETGPATAETSVGPGTAYGRIQELGGQSGRGHRTHTPARPYLKPAAVRLAGQLHEVGVAAFRQARDE